MLFNTGILLSSLVPYVDEITSDQCGFDVTDQLLIRFFADTWEKNGSKMKQYISNSYFKKACNSVRREVLYIILIEFGYTWK
jgi:hypothetical protein